MPNKYLPSQDVLRWLLLPLVALSMGQSSGGCAEAVVGVVLETALEDTSSTSDGYNNKADRPDTAYDLVYCQDKPVTVVVTSADKLSITAPKAQGMLSIPGNQVEMESLVPAPIPFHVIHRDLVPAVVDLKPVFTTRLKWTQDGEPISVTLTPECKVDDKKNQRCDMSSKSLYTITGAKLESLIVDPAPANNLEAPVKLGLTTDKGVYTLLQMVVHFDWKETAMDLQEAKVHVDCFRDDYSRRCNAKIVEGANSFIQQPVFEGVGCYNCTEEEEKKEVPKNLMQAFSQADKDKLPRCGIVSTGVAVSSKHIPIQVLDPYGK